jgi:superfamily I DNA/RNA helicase
LASSAVLFRYNFERERFVKNLAKNDIPFHGKLISHPNGPVAVKRSKSMSALLCILNASTWEAEACIEAIKLNCSGKAEIEIMARFLEEQDLSGDSADTEKRLVAIIQSKSPNMKCKAVICSALKKIRSVAKQTCGKGSVEMAISEFKIKRTKDIKEFMVKVEKFQSVAAILCMVKENDDAFVKSRTTKQGIFVGTIHASKGREWKTVILPFLNEGTLPSERANVDEERRVMYVAMTRAVDTLLITCNESGPPSRFLQDAKLPLTRNFNEFTSLYTSTR